MKAATRSAYGPPEVLIIREIPEPVPANNEILIKVKAATVNRTDCGILFGNPFIIRFFTGLTKPRDQVTGTDFAGRIEVVGKDVKSFKVGDRVWGFDDNGLASHAEYMALAENKAITTIPGDITYEQAAASIEGAHYAYNFIKKVNLQPGQKVLVNGASGAIGSAMVQLLKYFHAEVTAVCGTETLDLVRSLGADRVIDYLKTDFTLDDGRYNYIFDAVGKSSFGKSKRLLLRGGVYISSELGPRWENLYLPLITRWKGDQKVVFPVPLDIKGSLAFMRSLLEQGKFRPVIDRSYPLKKIKEAFGYVASGQKTGNVIITMAHENGNSERE
jgi:NADPH:quinone reductase-like Zn-dependent oxidoreductase